MNPGQKSCLEVDSHGFCEDSDLELALTPPTDGSNIKATVVRLTPEDAHNILSLRNFQRHRRIVQGAAP